MLNSKQFIWQKIANKRKKRQKKNSDRQLFTHDALNVIYSKHEDLDNYFETKPFSSSSSRESATINASRVRPGHGRPWSIYNIVDSMYFLCAKARNNI